MWRTPTSSKISRNTEQCEVQEHASTSPAPLLSPTRCNRAAQDHEQDTDDHPTAGPVYDGTGARVIHQRNEDSVISLFSNEDIDAGDSTIFDDSDSSAGDRASRSSSDDSSEVTALASRPQYLTVDAAMDATATSAVLDQSESASLSSSLDDMVTPGLHTAGMASLHFGNTFDSSNSKTRDHDTTAYTSAIPSSRPSTSSHHSSTPQSPGIAPVTLASYLSSTLSSPKTRSFSSGSLASFPTDFLSDVSRPESVDDTDDGASEFHSDTGGDPSSSTSQLPMRSRRSRHDDLLRDSADLVMPKLAPASAPDSHEGSSPSDSDKAYAPATAAARRPARGKQGSASSNGTSATGCSAFPRILMAGGTAKQQDKVRAALTRGGDTPVGKGNDSAAPGSGRYSDRVEGVESLAAAGERVVRPFTVLQTVVRPEIPTTDSMLLESLLPNLLEQVAAVSVCLLILDAQDGKTLAQHVLEQFERIHELARFTTLVPILVQADDASGRDSVSQLTQGSIDWLGKDRNKRLSSLRSKARPYHLEDLEGLASALVAYDFNSTIVKYFQRWNSPNTTFTDRTRSAHGRHGSRRAEEQLLVDANSRQSDTDASGSPSAQSRGQTQEPPSLASSMLDSVTLPPSSLQSGSSSSSQEIKARCQPPVTTSRGKVPNCYNGNMDPLHLPSLVRLVGLNLAASFSALATTIKSAFTRSEDGEEAMIRNLLKEDAAKAAEGSRNALSAGVRPFYGCCGSRYSSKGTSPQLGRSCNGCGGILLAGIIVGMALWFS